VAPVSPKAQNEGALTHIILQHLIIIYKLLNRYLKPINSMKKYSIFLFLSMLTASIYAQNVGIGTTTPVLPLHFAKPHTALLLVEPS